MAYPPFEDTNLFNIGYRQAAGTEMIRLQANMGLPIMRAFLRGTLRPVVLYNLGIRRPFLKNRRHVNRMCLVGHSLDDFLFELGSR